VTPKAKAPAGGNAGQGQEGELVQDRLAATSGDWGKVPKEVAQIGLTKLAIRVFIMLSAHANKARQAWPSQDLLVQELDLPPKSGRRNVRRALLDLQANDLIVSLGRYRRKDGTLGTNTHIVAPFPTPEDAEDHGASMTPMESEDDPPEGTKLTPTAGVSMTPMAGVTTTPMAGVTTTPMAGVSMTPQTDLATDLATEHLEQSSITTAANGKKAAAAHVSERSEPRSREEQLAFVKALGAKSAPKEEHNSLVKASPPRRAGLVEGRVDVRHRHGSDLRALVRGDSGELYDVEPHSRLLELHLPGPRPLCPHSGPDAHSDWWVRERTRQPGG
jgi:hypothetical protein